jgi:hypothetical protein
VNVEEQYAIGDQVAVMMHDGHTFAGPLNHWNAHWLELGGLAFPLDDIRAMQHA